MFHKEKSHSRFHVRSWSSAISLGLAGARKEKRVGTNGAHEGGGECSSNFSRLLKLRFLAPALLSRCYLSKYCHTGDTITTGTELKIKSCLLVFTPAVLLLLFCSKIYFFSSPKRSFFTWGTTNSRYNIWRVECFAFFFFHRIILPLNYCKIIIISQARFTCYNNADEHFVNR